jgi:hypothetical protein
MKKIVVALLCGLLTETVARAYEAATPASTNAVTPAVVEQAAPKKDWKAEVGLDYFSEYVFRGVDVSRHQPVIVPHALAGWKGLTATFVGYYSDYDAPGNDWYTEHDYSLDYTHTFGKLNLTAGGLYYSYPRGRSGVDTWDLYGVAAYDFPLLNPKMTINWDVDKFHTGYGTASISHPFDLTKTVGLKDPMTLTITPSAALGIDFGYNSQQTKANVNWNDVLLGLSAGWQITKNIQLHTGVQFSIALDSLHEINQHNEVIGNAGITLTF